MTGLPPHARGALVDRLQQLKPKIAGQATRMFLDRHPEWLAKYGGRARRFGIEDAGFHIEFLRGAVEAASVQAYSDYCEWASGLLRARSIDSRFLVEHLTDIETVLHARLSGEETLELAPYFEAGREACSREKVLLAQPATPLALTRNVYLQSILIGSRAGSARVVDEALRNGAGMFDIYAQVFQDALYEVGRLWEEGRISVSVEHRATAITQFVMAGLYSRALAVPPANPVRSAVVTGVAGELHQIGANMVADVLENAGWSVGFLGTDAPHSGIVAAVEAECPDLLCISATMLFNLPSVVKLIQELRDRRPKLRVLIGGAAFRTRPDLWRDIGADGFAPDLHSAVEAANRLLSARIQ